MGCPRRNFMVITIYHDFVVHPKKRQKAFSSKGRRIMVSYNKLWKLLINENTNKKDLIALSGISTTSMAKLSKGQNIQTDAFFKICKVLNRDFKDIMEYIPD